MDSDMPYKDKALRCSECKGIAVHVYLRMYGCGCIERIITCVGCDHLIWVEFAETCAMRKDIIIMETDPKNLH
jgi:hypothetical protein